MSGIDENWVRSKIDELGIIELYKNREYDAIIRTLSKETKSHDLSAKLPDIETLWNSLGIHFIEIGMHDYALLLYREMAGILEDLGRKHGKHYHKGTPYHNMAVAYLRMGAMEQGRSCLISAYWEDLIDTCGNLEEAHRRPAYEVYVKVFGIEPPLPEQVTLTSSEVVSVVNSLPDAQRPDQTDRVIAEIRNAYGAVMEELKGIEQRMRIDHETILKKIEPLDEKMQILILEIESIVSERGEDAKSDFLDLLEEIPIIGDPIRITRKIMSFVEKHGLKKTQKMEDALQLAQNNM